MIKTSYAQREGTKVLAYDFTTRKFVGEYDSIHQAARRLFIRSHGTIYCYATKKEGKKCSGVKSYKGQVYHFELAKPE